MHRSHSKLWADCRLCCCPSRGYALRLIHSITAADLARWHQGTPIDWVTESHEIAEDIIYRQLLENSAALPASYGAQMLPVVDAQLEKAGIRLARILNQE